MLQALALPRDALVADIGAGTGYFAVRLARALPAGRVFAVDTEAGMVEHLARRAQRRGLTNLVPVHGKPDDPMLPEKVDLVLLVDVYHHVDDRSAYFARLKDQLKPGGRLAVIDFHLESPHGPPRAMRVEPDQVRAELNDAGYRVVAERRFLPYQYFLVFEPAQP